MDSASITPPESRPRSRMEVSNGHRATSHSPVINAIQTLSHRARGSCRRREKSWRSVGFLPLKAACSVSYCPICKAGMSSTETSVSARPASQNAGSARKKPVHAASRCDAAGPDGTWEISADCRAQTDVCARVKGPRSALRSMQYSACGPSAALIRPSSYSSGSVASTATGASSEMRVLTVMSSTPSRALYRSASTRQISAMRSHLPRNASRPAARNWRAVGRRGASFASASSAPPAKSSSASSAPSAMSSSASSPSVCAVPLCNSASKL